MSHENVRHVKLGPKLFSKEKTMYRDWITALARENIQNSVDASASRIDITIEHDGDLKKITFADNGPGMDMATLENIYFVLGETTKTSPTSIGGFGVARMLTAFAQEKYTLKTRDIFIEGCGAEWTPQTGQPFYEGVVFTAWVDAKDRNVLEAFQSYLRSCHIQASVYLNGQRWKEWTHKNKHERSLSFGEVYSNKSKQTGVIVRSNGVTMFTPYLSAPFQVVIELDSMRSRSILQAHRDGLLRDYQNELESFVNELNINKESALRQKRSKSIKYEGTGTFTSKRSKNKDASTEVEEFIALLAANNLRIEDTVAHTLGLVSPENRKEIIQGVLESNNLIPAVTARQLHSDGYDNEETSVRLDFKMFNVMVEDDTTNDKVRKVIESYYPHRWDLLGENGYRYDKRYGENRSFRAGVDKYKLLILWKAACEKMVEYLQDNLQRGPDEIAWSVGWHFSDQAAASCKHDVGTHWLLLNPCLTDGTMKYSLAVRRDLIKIISMAAHEVCHVVYGDHDERFANLLNDLLEEAMANSGDVLKHMKDSKDSAMGELERISDMNKAVA